MVARLAEKKQRQMVKQHTTIDVVDDEMDEEVSTEDSVVAKLAQKKQVKQLRTEAAAVLEADDPAAEPEAEHPPPAEDSVMARMQKKKKKRPRGFGPTMTNKPDDTPDDQTAGAAEDGAERAAAGGDPGDKEDEAAAEPPPLPPLKLVAATMLGQKYEVEVMQTDTVLDLKMVVEKAGGAAPEDQTLLHGGVKLTDETQLTDVVGLVDGSELQLMLTAKAMAKAAAPRPAEEEVGDEEAPDLDEELENED